MTAEQNLTADPATSLQNQPVRDSHPAAAALNGQPQPGRWTKLGVAVWRWAARYPFLVVVLACVACLGPFINKAYHIDDPLFLFAAEHIREEPANFYNFSVVWYDHEMPMYEVTKNPPLASYYIALVSSLFGWGEVPMHLAYLVWPIGALWGTYRLAQRHTKRPLLAALVALVTPVFLVSSTNVMCDTMMTCIWIWTMVLWDRALDRDRWPLFVAAGLLMGICPLAKYFAMSLIPLLFAYGLFRKRRLGWWMLTFLIPVAILGAYQWYTYTLYGRGLLSDAAAYAGELHNQLHTRFQVLLSFARGLSYTGGCVAAILFFAPVLWSRRTFWVGCFVAMLLGIVILDISVIVGPSVWSKISEIHWAFGFPGLLYCGVGLLLLWVAAADLWVGRDAFGLLLCLWLFGTFIFAAFVNWSINGRSILPMVPAIGIIIARQADRHRGQPNGAPGDWLLMVPLIPVAVLGLMVTWADYALADSGRSAAREISGELADRSGKLWYEGHWGFQYYMRQAGAEAVDLKYKMMEAGGHTIDLDESGISPGDWLAVPSNNTYITRLQGSRTELVRSFGKVSCSWLTTMMPYLRAGFYAHTYGDAHLPYSFGWVPPEVYTVYHVPLPEPPLLVWAQRSGALVSAPRPVQPTGGMGMYFHVTGSCR